MQISTLDARGIFTTMLADRYRELAALVPTSFLQSFFPAVEYSTLKISIEVERGFEKVAVDVERGSEGNRNDFSKSTEKQFIPPYFREWFDKTDLDLYDRLFGGSTIDMGIFQQLLEDVAEKTVILQKKILRAYELQCAQVLETGIVTLNEGTNIDFKRKAASKVDVDAAGDYWTVSTANPYNDLEDGGNFLRQVGKSQGGVINAIYGSEAWRAFEANDEVQARSDIRNFSMDSLRMPQRNSVGATLLGVSAAGSFEIRHWVYNEYYDDASNTSTPYLNPKKVILLPENPRFKMAFAAVPQLIDEENPTPKKGAFVLDDYKDKKKATHEYHVKSAGVPIPTAVDQIYTMQVVA